MVDFNYKNHENKSGSKTYNVSSSLPVIFLLLVCQMFTK